MSQRWGVVIQSPIYPLRFPLELMQMETNFDEEWEYAIVVGMLMHLAQNSRPDISYDAHQCARFTHAPIKSHGIGIKIILRYLQGTKNKGLIPNPSTKLQVD